MLDMNISFFSHSKFTILPMSLPVILSLGFSSAVLAQTSGDAPLSKEGAQKAVKNAVETTQEASKPLDKQKSKALLEMRKRAAAMRNEHAAYLKKVVNGTVNPQAELLSKMPKLKQDTAKLKILHDQYLELMKNNSELSDLDYRTRASELSTLLRAALQPLAPYLMEAIPHEVAPELTKLDKAQIKELGQLNQAQRFPQKETQQMLEVHTPRNSATLIYLPIPIEISAPVGAEVYLEALAGGRFSNDLPMQKLVIGKSGKVKTYWYSVGDSVGLGSVQITSPQCGNHIGIGMNVVAPIVRPIPSLPDPSTVSPSALKDSSKLPSLPVPVPSK